MYKLVEAVDERIIEDVESYDAMINQLVCKYEELDYPQFSVEGIRDKIRSLAYVYQLFKRFVFKTAGVEYNFRKFKARVNELYTEKLGKVNLFMQIYKLIVIVCIVLNKYVCSCKRNHISCGFSGQKVGLFIKNASMCSM